MIDINDVTVNKVVSTAIEMLNYWNNEFNPDSEDTEDLAIQPIVKKYLPIQCQSARVRNINDFL